ncbi:M12 family metallopeptidase [uncultured Aquimarina sp.]|uniref:M12 family metallopeptidase n=1 Tax=uncultured Aquimarina sp. TaxID=575652 RepID=UPI002614ABBC|nr:M12 family metallopeptidase [uncultured Aquimarina sp.]
MKTKNLMNFGKAAFICLGLLASSCTNEDFEESEQIDNIQLEKKSFLGEAIYVESIGNGDYIAGDVIYNESMFDNGDFDFNSVPGEVEKLGLAPGVTKWPNNTIIYVLSSNLTSNQRQVTLESIEQWSSKTNIKFKERTNESYYVTIRNNGDNCNCANASLGVQGTRGTINMGVRTGTGVMTHEIGHTLGYLHEQNRSDRDQFVRIFPENIQNGAISQFRISSNSVNPGAFDVQSIMIYSSFTFSKNGQPVMLELDGTRIPFNGRLSAGDIAGTNLLYPGGDGGGDGNDICEGIEEWSRNIRYNVGDKVTYQGFLYERDFNSWNQIGKCGDTQTADICEGIDAYSSNRNYSPGNQVTYNGSLYTLQDNRRWSNQGRCGSN